MKIYVVIPSYIVTDELVELTKNTIKSFRESYPEAIIINVDDGSPMDCKWLEELSDVYIKNPVNSGFAISCNNGFRYVLGLPEEDAYIICANNDIEINKKTIPALIVPFEMFRDVAITGIISTKQHTWEGKPLEEMDLGRMTGGGLLNDRMMDGGLWCSKKSILEKIGLFDERFIRGGFEDIDLFLRARDTFEMKIVMNGRACYWHKQGATRWNCEKNNFVNNFGIESKKIEQLNYEKFKDKWGFDPHTKQLWFEKELFNV